jgi:hypothetical protein
VHNLLQSSPYKLVAVVLFVVAATLFGCRRRIVSVEAVDKMIKDQVPVGSDKQQVMAFIDNLKVDSLEIRRDQEFHPATRLALGTPVPEKVAELGDKIAEYIGAVILKAQSDGILTFDDIVIAFYMDKDGRMIGYTVKMEGAV